MFLHVIQCHCIIIPCFVFQERNDQSNPNPECFICKSTKDEDRLKQVYEQIWTTLKNASALRKNLNSDKYNLVTQCILATHDHISTLFYHPKCHKLYTAVKRSKERLPTESETTAKNVCVETRSISALPKSDHQGLLKGTCIFCGKARKKKNGKEEQRLQISTFAGCDSLCRRVNCHKMNV